MTIKQQPNDTQKHKPYNEQKERKNAKKHSPNQQATRSSSPVRTAHMSVHTTGYNCGRLRQYSTEQF